MSKPFVIQNPYKNTPDPPNRLVSVGELEEAIQGVAKSPVRAAATTDVNGVYDKTAMTLTIADSSWTVDGITPVLGDRILLVGQTDKTQNGIYEVTVATGSGPIVLTRASDFNSSSKIYDGAKVWVGQGGNFKDTSWTLTTDDPFTLDTTPIEFTQDKASSTAGVVRKIGSLTEKDGKYVFEHNLNDPYPIVELYNTQRSAVELADIEFTDANTVTVDFAVAPTDLSVYKIIVHGQPQD